jgi:hypothetical protein
VTPGEWTSLVAELSKLPETCARLLREHTDDGHGFCRACTTPGRGTRGTRFPCSVATLARAAIEVTDNARKATDQT